MPTSAGTANNYRRVANEVDDQNQADVRIDHRIGDRDQLFARLSRFQGTFLPVTPLPEGSGVDDRHAGPAGHHVLGAGVELPAHVLAEPAQRGPLRRYAAHRGPHRGDAGVERGLGAEHPRHSGLRAVPRYAADVHLRRRLSAARITSQHGHRFQHQRVRSGRHADLGARPPHGEGRLRLALGAAERHPAAVAHRLVRLQHAGQRPARRRRTPARQLASFLLGQVQTFSIDLQTEQIQERASFQEYFVQDDWRVSNRFTISPGLRYTLNFPSTEINGQTAVFNPATQLLEYPGDEPVRPLKKDNFGPRLGLAYRVNDKTLVSTGYGAGVDRDGRHHDAVHHAVVPVPADGHPARARHRQSGVRAAERSERGPDRARADGGRGAGRVRRGRHARLGLRAAVECVGAARTDEQHDHRGCVRRFEDHACRHPRYQHQPADGRPARAGSTAPAARGQPVLRHHPALVVAR